MSASQITILVTNIGILLGLAVVIYEVQQTNTIARTQLIGDGYALASVVITAQQAEELPHVLERACFTPELVTGSDAVVLDGYFNSLWYSVRRVVELRDLGFGRGDVQEQRLIALTTQRIASFPAGRSWYQNVERATLSDDVRKIADVAFAEVNAHSCAGYLSQFMGSKLGPEAHPEAEQ